MGYTGGGGAVSIVMPANTTPDRIDQFLTDKRRWIKEKSAVQHELLLPVPSNICQVERSRTLNEILGT